MADYTGFSIYIIGFIMSIIFAVKAQKTRVGSLDFKKWRSYIPIILSCLSLWIIAAFRYKVGLDWDNYETQFNNITNIKNIGDYFEPGFGLLNLAVSSLGGDFHWLIAITSLLTGFLLWLCLYKYSSSIWLAIFGVIAINLYAMSFSVIRQFISISVVLLSVQYIQSRDWMKFIIILCIAFSLHYTALVFAPMYFLFNDSNNLLSKKNIFVLIVVLLIFAYLDIFLKQVFIFSGGLRDTYVAYQDSETTKSIKEVLMYLPVFIYIISYHKKLLEANEANKVFVAMFFLWIIFKIVGLYEPSLSRVQYYFAISGPILLSYAPAVARNNVEKLLLVLAIVVFYTWDFSHVLRYQWEDFLPYYSVF